MAEFTIVGAGLAGSLMATSLSKAGHTVDVYEKRSDPRVEGISGGRSINLALSTRGIDALARVGMDKQVLEQAIPMRGRMMHDESGVLSFQPYSKSSDDAIYSVSRGGLNVSLLDAADEDPNVTLHFDHRCDAVSLSSGVAQFTHPQKGTVKSAARPLIGADGAFSAVRQSLFRQHFNYAQDFLPHVYKELTIPPLPGGGFALDPNALHIWPRGAFMMIALPNADQSFTCTLFWPHGGRFCDISDAEDICEAFETHFGDAVPLMPTLVEDFRANPEGALVTVRCGPWHAENCVTLIGDAAHAVVPFYGQGMNCSFEDCTLLADALARHDSDEDGIGCAFREFFRGRKEDADALADLAIANYREMSDHVASPRFLMRKKIERLLHRHVPSLFTPLYSMVSFSRIPYAEAVRKAKRQEVTLRRLVWLGLGILVMALSSAARYGVSRFWVNVFF